MLVIIPGHNLLRNIRYSRTKTVAARGYLRVRFVFVERLYGILPPVGKSKRERERIKRLYARVYDIHYVPDRPSRRGSYVTGQRRSRLVLTPCYDGRFLI